MLLHEPPKASNHRQIDRLFYSWFMEIRVPYHCFFSEEFTDNRLDPHRGLVDSSGQRPEMVEMYPYHTIGVSNYWHVINLLYVSVKISMFLVQFPGGMIGLPGDITCPAGMS